MSLPYVTGKLWLFAMLALELLAVSSEINAADGPGDAVLADYFVRRTDALTAATVTKLQSREWEKSRGESRRQLAEMLGLDPLPEKTPLQAVVTGKRERDGIRVENLHFQALPGLYVTGNLYLPATDQPAPAILYVCGHSLVKKDGISYGNKTAYQHHGAWFAQNGYVCLVIDTLQMGEIEGIHHGTYNKGMWWWPCRGYTSAGVEAWNSIRAVDYLQSRPEVDPQRIGVTGRSGGGAYSWWVAALDDRIKAAVPVAGITSLRNHVVDGCVAGHCDCMFPVNTYQWDFPEVVALVAPRPLLISNTDKDTIFPLDGVVEVHRTARKLYEFAGVPSNYGLQICEGPHKDTQELRVHALVWMNRFLRKEEPDIRNAAEKLFEPAELKVFETLPTDQKNTTIHETFVPAAALSPPTDAADWKRQTVAWRAALANHVFRAWPAQPESLDVTTAWQRAVAGLQWTACDFTSQTPYRLRMFLLHRPGLAAGQTQSVRVEVLDQVGYEQLSAMYPVEPGQPPLAREPSPSEKILAESNDVTVYLVPRGVGPTEWSRDERKRTQIRRRFVLLGETDDGMRIWDIRRGLQALAKLPICAERPLTLCGELEAATWATYASLNEPTVKSLQLTNPPRSHRDGPVLLNILRFLDFPAAVALAGETAQVKLIDTRPNADSAWAFPVTVAKTVEGVRFSVFGNSN